MVVLQRPAGAVRFDDLRSGHRQVGGYQHVVLLVSRPVADQNKTQRPLAADSVRQRIKHLYPDQAFLPVDTRFDRFPPVVLGAPGRRSQSTTSHRWTSPSTGLRLRRGIQRRIHTSSTQKIDVVRQRPDHRPVDVCVVANGQEFPVRKALRYQLQHFVRQLGLLPVRSVELAVELLGTVQTDQHGQREDLAPPGKGDHHGQHHPLVTEVKERFVRRGQ
jgi:hypothetical protein